MLKPYLARLVDGFDLSRAEAHQAMRGIMGGEATPAQIAGFLVALRVKGETVEEIAGFAEAMRSVANRMELPAQALVDTCGTGGDGAGTFNISTAAALVAAASGVPVAKHGNRSVSSACGSADVLEALGVTLVSSPAALARSLQSAGLAFLFAPVQHPAMKHAIGPRRELALRTVFNLLGPLTNPAGARRQVLGVYSEDLVQPMAEVLGRLGARRALVVHGAGGIDEISVLGPTRVAEWDGSCVRTYEIDPQELGIPLAELVDLAGGSPHENAATITAILDGEEGPRRDIVVLNAAAAIVVGGRAPALATAIPIARQAIDSGAARQTLAALVEVTAQGESA